MAHGHCTMQRCHLIIALVHVDAFLPNKKRSKNGSSWASSKTINESDHQKKILRICRNLALPCFLCCLDLVNFKPQAVPGKHLLQIHDYSLHGNYLDVLLEMLVSCLPFFKILQFFLGPLQSCCTCLKSSNEVKPPSFHPVSCRHCGYSITMLGCRCWGPC